jgi:hypothetical protein
MARVGCALHACCTAAAADAQDEPRQKRRRRSLAFAPGKAARCAASHTCVVFQLRTCRCSICACGAVWDRYATVTLDDRTAYFQTSCLPVSSLRIHTFGYFSVCERERELGGCEEKRYRVRAADLQGRRGRHGADLRRRRPG